MCASPAKMLKIKVNLYKFLIFVLIVHNNSPSVSSIILHLSNGKINGTANTTRSNTTFFSFFALRYAQPPIGQLRFQSPQEELPWNDVYDATKERNICYQVISDSSLENEDCLFANVHTPYNITASDNDAKLPVMVYIHGGGFIAGNGLSAAWGPKFFMDYGVILVTFNYRLGPFGFMSTGDTIIPGNLGLKDQVRLLEWVQKNIQYFGGDPKKVTIFGESSGGGSVGYLVLSPLAAGLFRGAIHQSGSGLSPLAYQRNQTNLTYLTAAQLDSKYFDENNRNSTELLKFLQEVSSSELDAASFNVTNKLTQSSMANVVQLINGFYYAPVIEVNCKNAFITEKMYGSFERGLFNRVPVILGFNGDEALGLISNKSLAETISQNYDNDPTYLVSQNMHISNNSTKNTVGNIIKSHFTEQSSFQDKLISVVNFHSSHNLEKPIIKQAELQAKHAPVWFYQFKYSGKMGNNKVAVFPGTTNVCHGEELNYLFSRKYDDAIPDNTDLAKFPLEDQIVHKRFITLWTNFAKYLNPTPETDNFLQNVIWPTVQPVKFKYLAIRKDLEVENELPKCKNYYFWDNLYEKFAKRPYDSY